MHCSSSASPSSGDCRIRLQVSCPLEPYFELMDFWSFGKVIEFSRRSKRFVRGRLDSNQAPLLIAAQANLWPRYHHLIGSEVAIYHH